MSPKRFALAASIVIAVSACGEGPKPAAKADADAPAAASNETASEADALARATIADMGLPDADGSVAEALAAAVSALPPWAPFYPGARLGADSATDGPGQVQVSFTTSDPEDKVASFYLKSFAQRGTPIDLKESGVRTIEVTSADGTQITSAILMPAEGGDVAVILKHEGGGY